MKAMRGTDGQDRARQIVEGLGDGFLSLDGDWRITDCNNATAGFFDARRETLLGRNLWTISGASFESPLGLLAMRVAVTRAPEGAEVTYPRGGEERLLAVQVFPLEVGVGVVWRDITEIRAAERQMAESEALYRELADGTPAAAWLARPDGELEFINQAMADALGQSREALLAGGWMSAIDPDDRAAMLEVRTEAWASYGAYHHEGRFRRPDGSLRILQFYGRPRFDRSGAFRGYVGMATDVTEAREAERRRQLLIDELNHRVKNTLATVLSLVRQTLRANGTAKDAEALLTGRVMALSAAHDVLTREGWEGAELEDIARAALLPFADAPRITIAGPPVQVGPGVAVALSIALHELGTNALKHGALSSDAGRVRLSWSRTGDRVDLEWRESGGPVVTAPQREGFGSRMLGRGLAGELGEPAELIFAPQGLTCRIRAPVKVGDRQAAVVR